MKPFSLLSPFLKSQLAVGVWEVEVFVETPVPDNAVLSGSAHVLSGQNYLVTGA